MPYSHMYKKPVSELRSDYEPVLINKAIRVWKMRGLNHDEIADKLNELQNTLQHASKTQFIAIYAYYDKEDRINAKV